MAFIFMTWYPNFQLYILYSAKFGIKIVTCCGLCQDTISTSKLYLYVKDTYFVIYGIISEFTDKGNFTSLPGQFQYLTLLRGLQGGLTCKFDQGLSTAKNLSIGCYFA